MEPAEVYKQRGEECERLAAECLQPWAKEALLDLACDFRRAAEELSMSRSTRREK